MRSPKDLHKERDAEAVVEPLYAFVTEDAHQRIDDAAVRLGRLGRLHTDTRVDRRAHTETHRHTGTRVKTGKNGDNDSGEGGLTHATRATEIEA